ncbi:MAG: type IV toxin-antitoxin system AbiEi family antitoxin [Gammaproteobacteria bacterium]
MLTENKQTLLERAIEAFRNETGLRLEIRDIDRKKQMDAIVAIEGKKGPVFAVEVKKWAQQLNLGALMDQIRRLPMKGLLVADYVNPNMAERFRNQGVQYIDTVGNAYINEGPLYIYVKGNKQPQIAPARTIETGRAFTHTGLKVVYAFLCDPDLVRATYREIAETADVALGTVGWVINDLKAGRYLIDRGGKNQRRLAGYRELLDRWVEVFPEKLKNKQLIGKYVAEVPQWWQFLDIRELDGYWGGEIAGAKYTNYLIPEEGTVYIHEQGAKKLFQQARLRKFTEAWYPGVTVWLYKPFWKKPDDYNGLVHPVLAYADLIATGDDRNIETARMIMDEHIDKHIREDR